MAESGFVPPRRELYEPVLAPAFETVTPYKTVYQEIITSTPRGSHCIGGSGGDVTADMFVERAAIRRMTVFQSSGNCVDDEDCLRGIVLEFTDGTILSQGGETHNQKTFYFQAGDRLVGELELCGNGKGSRTGYLKFKTMRGGEFEVGKKDGRDVYKFHVDGRYLMGFGGGFGADIDFLCPIVSRRIKASRLVDVTYPAYPVGGVVGDENIKVLKFVDLENPTPLPSQKKVEFEHVETSSLTHTDTWTHHFKVNMGLEVKFKASIPLIHETEVSTTFGMEYGYQNIDSTVNTTSEMIRTKITTAVTLESYSRVTVTVTQAQETMDLGYDGSLEMDFEDGTSTTVAVSGVLGGVLVSGYRVQVGNYVGPTPAPTRRPSPSPTPAPTTTHRPSSSPTAVSWPSSSSSDMSAPSLVGLPSMGGPTPGTNPSGETSTTVSIISAPMPSHNDIPSGGTPIKRPARGVLHLLVVVVVVVFWLV